MRVSLNVPETEDPHIKNYLKELQIQVNLCLDVIDKKIEGIRKEQNENG